MGSILLPGVWDLLKPNLDAEFLESKHSVLHFWSEQVSV